MCSDGFSGLMEGGLFSEKDVKKIVSEKGVSAAKKAEELVRMADDRARKRSLEEYDNITVDLVEI
jgi:serine/threonine protein phosphatase PrpC